MKEVNEKLKDIAKLHSDDTVSAREAAAMKDNERADMFSELWLEQRGSLSVDDKNSIAFSYLKNIVVDEETAEKFVRGDSSADYEVGMIHSGSEMGKRDYTSFWGDVSGIAPGYSDDDIQWLSKYEYSAVSAMMFVIEPAGNEVSTIMRSIRTNMHAYK